MKHSVTKDLTQFEGNWTKIKMLLKAFNKERHKHSSPKLLRGYSDFMEINMLINSINEPRATKRMVDFIRTHSVKWDIRGKFNELLYNLDIKEFAVERNFSPSHLFDMKNLMFYNDTINSGNIELFSNDSRMMIRHINRKMFQRKYAKYEAREVSGTVDKEENYPFRKKVLEERAKEYEAYKEYGREYYGTFTFARYIERFCTALVADPEIFTKDENFEYFLYIVELGLIDNENILKEILRLLSRYVDQIYEDMNEITKKKNGAYSDYASSDDDSSSSSSSSSSCDNNEDEVSYDEGGHGNKWNRVRWRKRK